jgi:hypothetical protein
MALLLQQRFARKKWLSRSGVIREANGAEFLKDHLQARLEVGLQKPRSPDTGHAPFLFRTFVSFGVLRGYKEILVSSKSFLGHG